MLLRGRSAAPSRTVAGADSAEVDRRVGPPPTTAEAAARPGRPMAAAIRTRPVPPELAGPQPVDAYIRRALAENRTVQAAYPQRPSRSSTASRRSRRWTTRSPRTPIFPIPSVAPQYSLMGYNPYNLTLAQQFPWFGTLRLRGEVADRDVQVALAELAAAQLDAVAGREAGLFRPLRQPEDRRDPGREPQDPGGLPRAVAESRLAAGGHPAGRAPGRGADQRTRPRAGEQPSRRSPRPAPPWPGRSTSSPEADLRTLPDLPLGGRPGRDRAALPAGHRRPPRAPGPARRRRPRREGRRAGPEAVLPQRHARPDLHGHGEDQRRDARRPPAASPTSACSSASTCRSTGPSTGPGSARPRSGPSPTPSSTRPSATRRYGEIEDFMAQAKVQQNVLGLLRDSILPRTERDAGARRQRLRQRATSTSRRSSRPSARCSRSSSRSPRSRASWARPSPRWSGPSAARSTSTRPPRRPRASPARPRPIPAADPIEPPRRAPRRPGPGWLRADRSRNPVTSTCPSAPEDGATEARRLAERVAEARRHHAHTTRAGPSGHPTQPPSRSTETHPAPDPLATSSGGEPHRTWRACRRTSVRD